ncbi:MAG: calcium-binding protein [Richelia sp. SL_2_1]|nr:calcium-binding protein [Richelia sp. SM1_7_0]NJO28192.1 calcium-binding protein [Richelia sp. SL_2_1]
MIINGGPKSDNLIGTNGADFIFGKGGNDTLKGGKGNDSIEGGQGNDFLEGGKGRDILKGDQGNDTLDGGEGDDLLEGGQGNDLLEGGKGDDILRGGEGKDTLDGGKGNDTLDGGKGKDVLKGSQGNDVLDGGKGDDTADYSHLSEAITLEAVGVVKKGSLGTDQILNIETIVGASGKANTIDGSTGTSGVTSFDVDLSQDRLTVQNIPGLGDVTFTVKNFVNVTGTSQDDRIIGNAEDNILIGGGGNDFFGGSAGNDIINGDNGGDDTVDYTGLGQAITLLPTGIVEKDGGLGTDELVRVETIIGDAGFSNTIDASSAGSPVSINVDLSAQSLQVNNIPGVGSLNRTVVNFVNVTGTAQNDKITGNAEDNIINGVDGQDILTGGAGKDIFVLGENGNVFYSDAGFGDIVSIEDFVSGEDKIQLTGSLSEYSFFNLGSTNFIALDNGDGVFSGIDDIIASVNASFNTTSDFIFA